MVDLAVSLPEPRPDDDEDVVWGLSTASALWARGEHGDAVVWLRRAVDAAASAGQEKRAADLLVATRRVEQTLEDSVRHTMPPPPLAERAAAETLPDLRVPAAPVPDRKSLGIEAELDPAALPPPPVAPTSTKPASSAPRPPATPAITRLPTGAPPPPPPRGPLPSYHFLTRPRVAPRAPILDPWAEEATLPSVRVDPTLRGIHLEGDEVVVQMRRPVQARGVVADDEDVVTSAAPLDVTLRNTSKPPALRKPIEQPGHIADAAVPSKTAPRPPPPPRASSADPSRSASPSSPAPDAPSAAPPSPPPSAAPASAAAPLSRAPMTPLSRPPSAPTRPAATPTSASEPAVSVPAVTSPSPSTASRPLSVPPRPVSVPPRPSSVAPPPLSAAPAAPPSSPVSTPVAAPLDSPTMPSAPSPLRARAQLGGAPADAPQPFVPRVPVPAAPAVAAPAAPVKPSVSAASIRLPGPASTRPPSVRPPAAPSVRPPAPASVRPPPPRPAPSSPTPRAASSRPPPPAALSLDGVPAFAELAVDVRQRLAAQARVDGLAPDEEVSGFGAALVIDGAASICATIVDAPVAPAPPRALITARGTLSETIALRIVAGSGGARVAIWESAAIDDALRGCPRVLDELVQRADRLLAMAGATMGPLHDLDDATRAEVLDQLSVRVARAGESIVEPGGKLAGLTVVCVGAVDLGSGAGLVRAGELLFPRVARRDLPAPTSARAASSGALLLVGDRALADRLAAVPALAGEFRD